MKLLRHFTLLVSLFLFSSNAHSQNYQLLPDSCTYCHYWYRLGGSTWYSANYELNPNNDTTIQGNDYILINWPSSSPVSTFNFAVRQVGNKMFGLTPGNPQEDLIMDFDANVGDTIFNLYSNNEYFDAVVLTKDSILMNNGYYLHYMDLEGFNMYSSNFFGSWSLRWNELGLCGFPYGGVTANIPLDEMTISSQYANPNYCSSDPRVVNPNTLMCGSCILQTNSIEELTPSKAELLKVVDLMGRDAEPQKGQMVIYIFSDGTKRKAIAE